MDDVIKVISNIKYCCNLRLTRVTILMCAGDLVLCLLRSTHFRNNLIPVSENKPPYTCTLNLIMYSFSLSMLSGAMIIIIINIVKEELMALEMSINLSRLNVVHSDSVHDTMLCVKYNSSRWKCNPMGIKSIKYLGIILQSSKLFKCVLTVLRNRFQNHLCHIW